jgi:hypothetical protein
MADDKFALSTNNRKEQFEIALYKQLLEPSNPYVSYNNVDRFLNVSYRFYTTGKLEKLYKDTGNQNYFDNAGKHYELRTNVMSQYYWASTAWLGAAYALNRPGLFSSSFEDRSIAAGLLSRALINLVLESALLVANGVRYAGPMVATGVGDRKFAELEQYVFNPQMIDNHPPGVNPGNNPFVPAVRIVHPPTQASVTIFGFFQPGVNSHLQNSVISRVVANTFRPGAMIKNLRSYAGSLGSAGFALNAMISIALQSTILNQVLYRKESNYKGNDKEVAVAASVFGLTVSVTNLVANSLKSLDSFGKTLVDKPGIGPVGPDGEAPPTRRLPRLTAKTTKRLGIAGTAFGLVHGLAGIVQFVPYLFSDQLTSEQKGVIGAEVAFQTAGGLTAFASNIWVAQSAARNLSYTGRLAMPTMGLAFGAFLVAVSPLEIYALSQQSKYAAQLKELGERLGADGYQGNSQMGDFYHDKTGMESGVLTATTLLGLVGTVVTVAMLAAPGGAVAATAVGLAVGIINGLVKGLEQVYLKRIVEAYAQKIMDAPGGSRGYFGEELGQQYNSLINSNAFILSLDYIQSQAKVDSVVAVTSIKMSQQAAQWAANTHLTEDLKTSDSYIKRFQNGKKVDDGSAIKMDTGVITLTGDAGKTQLLTFLQPLAAPGVETRKRQVNVGKSSATTLRIIPPTGVNLFKATTIDKAGWTINDSDASTTMDLSQVVTRVTDVNKKVVLEVPLAINGGGGNDTVLANTSQLIFDGGDGYDIVDYSRLKGNVGLTLTVTGNRATVTKVMDKVETIHETAGANNFVNGKETNKFETRDFEVSKTSATETDVFTNVEQFKGSDGKDLISVGPVIENGSAGVNPPPAAMYSTAAGATTPSRVETATTHCVAVRGVIPSRAARATISSCRTSNRSGTRSTAAPASIP